MLPLLSLALPLVAQAAGDEDATWDVASVPVGLAKETFDMRVEEAQARYGARLADVLPDWEAQLQKHARTLADARADLRRAVEAAIKTRAGRGEVEESLLLDRARALIADGAPIPATDRAGTRKAGRGSRSFGTHKYLVVTDPLPWYAAKRYCEEAQGYLATADTPAELEFLASLVDSATWLGGTDAAREGEWRWVTGNPVHDGWLDGQPDNSDGIEHVMSIDERGRLNDYDEGKRLPFVCEWGDAVPDPWDFESPSARKAKEKYDRDVAASAKALESARLRLDRQLVHGRDECRKDLATAQRTLGDDLEDAVVTETRRERLDVVRDIRKLVKRTREGAFTPTLGPLGARPVPDGARRHRGHHYAVIREPLPWELARARCRELGGTLAVLTGPDELALAVEITGGKHAWVGASDLVAEGDWRWIDGSPVQRGWKSGEPNNVRGTEHVAVLAGELYDVMPGGREVFVCEWEY